MMLSIGTRVILKPFEGNPEERGRVAGSPCRSGVLKNLSEFFGKSIYFFRRGADNHFVGRTNDSKRKAGTMKLLGLSDEILTCECCGRTDLKCTMVIESESGGVVYYGRDCAATVLIGNRKPGTVKQLEILARAINYARKWLHTTPAHTAKVVARRICLTCPCWVVAEAIYFHNGTIVD